MSSCHQICSDVTLLRQTITEPTNENEAVWKSFRPASRAPHLSIGGLSRLIKVAGIDVDLWRIHDYASDALVLKLCSYTTVHKIMEYLYVRPNSDTTEMN
eukprot:scaffold103639_cov67-Attheya_sp.AAC.2